MGEKKIVLNLGRYVLAVTICMMFLLVANIQVGASSTEDWSWVPPGAPKCPKKITLYFKENYSKYTKGLYPSEGVFYVENIPELGYFTRKFPANR